MMFTVVAVAAALGTLTAMYLLIRRGWMKEKYTVVWLLAAFSMMVLAVFPPILDPIADLLQVQQGPNLLFLVADLAMMLICVQLSVEASTQSSKSRRLAEEVALLRLELEHQAQRSDDPTGPALTTGNSNTPAGPPTAAVPGDRR